MINRVYVTGDTHGNFARIEKWCDEQKDLTVDDVLIILGDAGINYYQNKKDVELKRKISILPITLVCVHGNNEERPENCPGYNLEHVDELECECWIQDEFPNIMFPRDGKMTINGTKFLVIGGAYSIDKQLRKLYGWHWFESEQLTDQEKDRIREIVRTDREYDYVLTHTCPIKYVPQHLFLRGVDQSKIDKSMEIFLNEIEEVIQYGQWLFGHYHADQRLNDHVALCFEKVTKLM